MLKKLTNCTYLLTTLTSLIGILGVSFLTCPAAFSKRYMDLRSSNHVTLPPGTAIMGTPNPSSGSPVNPNGGFTSNPDGTITAPAGTTITPSGLIISPNGQQIITPTGTVTTNGSFTTNPDGTITTPASSNINPNYPNSSRNCQQINPSGTAIGVTNTPQGVPINSNGEICY